MKENKWLNGLIYVMNLLTGVFALEAIMTSLAYVDVCRDLPYLIMVIAVDLILAAACITFTALKYKKKSKTLGIVAIILTVAMLVFNLVICGINNFFMGVTTL